MVQEADAARAGIQPYREQTDGWDIMTPVSACPYVCSSLFVSMKTGPGGPASLAVANLAQRLANLVYTHASGFVITDHRAFCSPHPRALVN